MNGLLQLFLSEYFPEYLAGCMLVSIVIGTVALLFGYRIYKIFLFITGAVVGAVVSSAFDAAPLHVILAALVAGCISVALWYLGVFFLGFGLGTLVAVTVGIHNLQILVILGVVGGVLALVIQKFITIVSTSWWGAGMIVEAIGYFSHTLSPETELVLTLVLAVGGVIFQYVSDRLFAPGSGGHPVSETAKPDAPRAGDSRGRR